MGLKAGEHGVKALLKTHAQDAFRNYRTLRLLRDDVLAQAPTCSPADEHAPSARSRTVALLDGNVLMMAVPQVITIWSEYVNYVHSCISSVHSVADLVVIVFDEPAHLTAAKRDEQVKRDACRKRRDVTCSNDLKPTLSHNFTLDELCELPDVHVAKNDRATRSRFYDAVARSIYDSFADRYATAVENGRAGEWGTLIFDGIDMRACDRPFCEPREAFAVGIGNQCVIDALDRDAPIGEGDIKLIWYETRIRQIRAANNTLFTKYVLALTITIDTDSLIIMIIDASKRRVAADSTDSTDGTVEPGTLPELQSVLCMRERAQLHTESLAAYLCCDTSMLESKLQAHVWQKRSLPHGRQPTPSEMVDAMLFVACAAAACGCDFTGNGLPGSRFDHFWTCLPEVVEHAIESSETPRSATHHCGTLTKLCSLASKHISDMPRYKRQAAMLARPDQTTILRAVWTAAYWAQIEYRNVEHWGFQPVQCG
tara:strand:- start:153 stop:1601 length:1449 start_codon:yes stop_codon:yes gene_type:complete